MTRISARINKATRDDDELDIQVGRWQQQFRRLALFGRENRIAVRIAAEPTSSLSPSVVLPRHPWAKSRFVPSAVVDSGSYPAVVPPGSRAPSFPASSRAWARSTSW